MGEIYDKLGNEFDEVAKRLSNIDLTTRQDYERFEKLTYYQNGIRFALDLMESKAIEEFDEAVKTPKKY